eukprot:1195686-Prorocentrum_minimum.AAC.4
MGGQGAWALATEYPAHFAAIVPREEEGDPGGGGLQGTGPRAQVAAGRASLRASLRGVLG